MKIIDERKTQKQQQKTATTTTKTNKDRKEEERTEAAVKVWEPNDFVVHLSFLQLMPKAFLTFKSNLELALSIILKERKLI